MTSKASPMAYEIAVSSAAYDARVLRELERRVAHRLSGVPAARRLWNRASDDESDVARANVFSKTARVVVVLHQHMWGKDETTKADAAAIKRRLTGKTVPSVRVVLLDHAAPPAWLAKVPTRALGEHDLEKELEPVADWIAEAVTECGGARRPVKGDESVVVPTSDERVLKQRDAFLTSHRAVAHLGREFDRLAGAVAKRVASVNRDETETPLEVHRVPGRCTVQLGPVALTLSWVRTRPDTVATGRLMIIEWDGQVARAGAGAPARAVPRRETVLRADATRVEDWQWRSEGIVGYAYDSDELAAHCVDSLAFALQDRRAS